MKKFSCALLLFCAAAIIRAEGVSYLTITDEAQYRQAADFTNTFEIKIINPGSDKITKCQAVRLDKNWYITAAHCISPQCDGVCQIQVRLVVNPQYEMSALITHSPKTQRVFKNDKTVSAREKAAYDAALMHIPADGADYIYRAPALRRAISEDDFLKIIPDYNIYYKAVNGTHLPDILHINSGYPVMIDRQASIVSIWNDERSVLPAKKPLFYLPVQKYIFTENFGIVQGISGSGVMTNTGELVGIVSATASLEAENRKTKNTVITPLVFIVPFDDYMVNFIRQTAPDSSISIKKARKRILKTIPPGQTFLPTALEKAAF
ncbi:MAG: hypothetical protein LBG16_05200 [Elusimicrobiota bacterium]|jgi:hypothetical protein|nr:hypothetical protein [Elusimicrobiota bacterium]